MAAIYICSTETCAGKTALAIGLARASAKRGGKVGYFKPVSVVESFQGGDRADGDAAFAKQVLSLSESLEVLSPVSLSRTRPGNKTVQPELLQRIKESFAIIARGKDVVFVEGPPVVDDGGEGGVPAAKVVEAIGARVLLVIRYKGDATVRKAAEAATILGQQPAAVVINGVPSEQVENTKSVIAPAIERDHAPVVWVLPLERQLLGGSVAELAGHLGGAVLCCSNNVDATIESVMIGARSFSTGLPYFSRKAGKAVVTGANRPDIQMAALETPTRCIVVTGNGDPNALVVERAKEARVPLIKVAGDTIETVDHIEQFLSGARFRQARKSETMDRVIAGNIDPERLSEALGLA
ncbi:MAG: phosphotransacetylase family protein [Chloroflexi bacterium]|nr:phosphotransacetylase family protein [Chloroflexota bacterium]